MKLYVPLSTGSQDSVGLGSFGFGTAVNQGQFGVGTQGQYEQGTGVIKGESFKYYIKDRNNLNVTSYMAIWVKIRSYKDE